MRVWHLLTNTKKTVIFSYLLKKRRAKLDFTSKTKKLWRQNHVMTISELSMKYVMQSDNELINKVKMNDSIIIHARINNIN